MFRIFLLTIIFLVSINAWGSEAYDVNWAELESATNSFLKNPTGQAADKIDDLLPPGKHASHMVGSFNSEAAERILNNIRPLKKLIDSGNSHAVRVVYAFTEISDGEYSEWLSEILGSSITNYPYEFLSGVKKRKTNRNQPCEDAVTLPYDFSGDHIQILKLRLNAIDSINDPSLKNEKECTTKMLKDYMKKSPWW